MPKEKARTNIRMIKAGVEVRIPNAVINDFKAQGWVEKIINKPQIHKSQKARFGL